jgi:hypothetical protein
LQLLLELQLHQYDFDYLVLFPFQQLQYPDSPPQQPLKGLLPQLLLLPKRHHLLHWKKLQWPWKLHLLCWKQQQ